MILDDLRHSIDEFIEPWAKAQGLEALPAYTLDEPPSGIDADVACNVALLLAKPLSKSPRAIAQELQKVLSLSSELVEKPTLAGAGFLNFRWTSTRLEKEIQDILNQKAAYGRSFENKNEKVLIEFVSANPTGPLHVGHGRGAAMGDSLALILAHLGHSVTREYYINDAGHQIQLLAESVHARCLELKGQPFQLPPEGYHGEYAREIAQEYLKAHPAREDDLDAIRSFSLRLMQRNIEKDLQDFGVSFDTWFSEDKDALKKGRVDKVVQILKEKGFVEEYEDALWFVAPGETPVEKDKNRVLRKRDGRWTYFATDIAYHAHKYERGFDRLIDMWGADHHGYVARVKGSMQALGYDPQRLHILLYQLVSLSRAGVPVSMSKRSGDFITLREVLDEVGRDACRFFFALRGPNTALEFDLELAKKQSQDNPVYYAQYAHARICSIFRQANNSLPPSATESLADARHSRSGGRGKAGMGGASSPASPPPPPSSPIKREEEEKVMGMPNLSLLKEKEERELMKRLALFPQTLLVCAQEDSPHPLANYLLLLCRQFHYFYDNHRVLGEDPPLTRARLALIDAVRQVLQIGLTLLGVSAPESM